MAKRRKPDQGPTPEPTLEEALAQPIFSRNTAVQKFIFLHPAGTRASWNPADVIKWWMRKGVVEHYTDEWVQAAYDAEQRGER